ncbi:MAG: C_GCAxxG_C_C family protein [Bacteroidales bacterium]|nr:C_GCAxxG_C_C family protein [Bacteroidales bacterium]
MTIDIESRVERARAKFREGYNCAQSVVLAYNDIAGLDDETAAKAAAAFGGGLARMRNVCGCVSGMAMLAGFTTPYAGPLGHSGKSETYRIVQDLAAGYKAETGSIICGELLGLTPMQKDMFTPQASERTPEYYKKRPCEELCGLAARLFGEYLQKQE